MKKNINGIMFMVASIGFFLAGIIGGEATFYVLGAVFLAIGAGTMKKKQAIED